MLFSSSIFLFGFLPLTLFLYFIISKSWRNSFLLFTSLLFYSWGEPIYIALMAFSITINYSIGLNLTGKFKTLLLIFGIGINLSLIGYFKYFEFLYSSLALLAEMPQIEIGSIHLPIGISFFTFQAISYLIDVYRKETPPQKKLVRLALYISLFPQLIAGPIVRYKDISAQLLQRSISLNSFALGVERFSIGLIKKVIIANNLAYVADQTFSNDTLDSPLAWIGIFCYSFQIYYDFSGYSDMAIGLGKMFGFTFRENFNYPYAAKSIKEFWHRWHISLSTWFRDYLYIPIGGNRINRSRTLVNLVVVFFLTGLWHGANWTFIIWGLFHGLFLIIERLNSNYLKVQIPPIIGHVYTLLVVLVGWVFFRSENIEMGFQYLEVMFSLTLNNDSLDQLRYIISKEVLYVFILASIFSLPTKGIILKVFNSSKIKSLKNIGIFTYRFLLLVLTLISMSYVAAETYNPFIYFRF